MSGSQIKAGDTLLKAWTQQPTSFTFPLGAYDAADVYLRLGEGEIMVRVPVEPGKTILSFGISGGSIEAIAR